MKSFWTLGLALLAAAHGSVSTEAAERSIPQPLGTHPGNVFLLGEEVVLRSPTGLAGGWRAFDYDDKEVTAARATGDYLNLGRLPVGFYRLRQEQQSNWISCAVIERLKAPTPLTSPVGLDVAMSWFYLPEKMAQASSLCALAGVNWVRDRLAWGQMEPKRGEWAAANRYDDSARSQSEAGLRVLQVNHSSPAWANPVTKRFPLDLRDAYAFHREMARRWGGQVLAFEPWNEADIAMFGGHTGSEMAALQKASYLGLKAGHPQVIACLNVFAMHNRAQLEDLRDNAAWPYFDTFNLHHYAPFDDYPKLYADFRAVSAGKPLWVTECALPVKWAGDKELKEPADPDLRVQAERVAKTFACSLHEGSAVTFYFLLPHYVEGQTQFGLLRPDLTPRPGYVALAAAGRLLANAKPLGRWTVSPDTVRAFLFRAEPDGLAREVMVLWTTKGQTNLAWPVSSAQCLDHLGRKLSPTDVLTITPAPTYVVLPEGSAAKFSLQPPPPPPARLTGQASPVVLQALWPETNTILSKSAYRLSSEKTESLPLFVYNFSDEPVSGRLDLTLPKGWRAGELGKLEIAPRGRKELRLELDGRNSLSQTAETVRITGDFGPAGQPVLSLRIVPEPKPSPTPPPNAKLTLERHLTLAPQAGNPRNSEGDFVRLSDGRWLFVYTHFTGGSGDHASAFLAARESSDGGRTWTAQDQVVVTNEGRANVMSVSLLRLKSGEIALFYLRKNSLQDCRPVMRLSRDEAKTWSDPVECISDEVNYYVLNNHRVIQLASGRLVLPTALHSFVPGQPQPGKIVVYLSDDLGRTWRRSGNVLDKDAAGLRVNLMEPGVVEAGAKRLLMVIRTKLGCQYLSESTDDGETWAAPKPSGLLSPEAPATLARIPTTGDLLVVWNDQCDQPESRRRSQPPVRTPLAAALSRDGGRTWEKEKLVEDLAGHGYCYTAIAFEGDRVLLAYCAHSSSYGLETTQISSFRLQDLYR